MPPFTQWDYARAFFYVFLLVGMSTLIMAYNEQRALIAQLQADMLRLATERSTSRAPIGEDTTQPPLSRVDDARRRQEMERHEERLRALARRRGR